MNKMEWLQIKAHLFLTMLLLGFLLGGCASMQGHGASEVVAGKAEISNEDNGDPFEKFNRTMFSFNKKIDKAIAKPIAELYVKYMPRPVRKGVDNVFSNLWEPNTIINAMLQGKGTVAIDSTARFLLNSTVGVLGVFDVATKLGVPDYNEDIGQTLAVWGVNDGPYLVLPFLGSSNVRDFSGTVVQWFATDLVPVIWDGSDQVVASGVRLLDTRANFLGADETLELQVDPYLFLRESYRQARISAIFDGSPPAEEDPFEEELFDD